MSSDQQFEVADLTWFAEKGGFSVTHLRKILIASGSPPNRDEGFWCDTPDYIFFTN